MKLVRQYDLTDGKRYWTLQWAFKAISSPNAPKWVLGMTVPTKTLRLFCAGKAA